MSLNQSLAVRLLDQIRTVSNKELSETSWHVTVVYVTYSSWIDTVYL